MCSCYMGFCNCNFKEVLTFCIKGARHDESLLLVQILNIQKSVSMVHILPTLFWRYIDIFPNRTYLDARLIGFVHSQFLVDPLGNKGIFSSVFPSIGHWSAVNKVVQAWLNLDIELVEGFALLNTCLNVVTKLLAAGALSTVVWEIGVDWCRFSNISFRWLFLGSGGNYCSGVVTWPSLWYWWCGRCSIL